MIFDLDVLSRGLPAAAVVDEVMTAVAGGGRVVVHAPAGTGKTTLVPPAVANAVGGEVLVCAPRRVAARAAARRLAQLSGTRVGDVVGFRVRGQSRPGSRVTFVTPGVLLRQVVGDPELSGVSAVVVDEVHERHAEVDVALGMLVEASMLRDDLSLVVMSATLSAQRFSDLLEGARAVSASAPIHPVEVSYVPAPGRAGGSREFYEHVAATAVGAFAHVRAQVGAPASVLVFVPGVREANLVADAVAAAGVPVVVLHGQLSAAAQDAALDPSAGARVIVSTSLAESSVTVPGVRGVVDAGLARQPRRDQLRQMQGLVTVSCAASQAVQRAGRAGREGPGWVWRCFSEAEFQALAPDVTPGIATGDVTQLLLFASVWGVPRLEGLPLLDPPAPAAVDAGQRVLCELGLVDDAGAVTALGRVVSGVPADPRLGRALLVGGPAAAPAVAVLADDPRGVVVADRAHPQVARLAALAGRASTEPGFSSLAASGVLSAGVVAALAFPSRLARRVSVSADGRRGVYQLAQGTRARLDASITDGVLPEWLAVVDISVSGFVDAVPPPRDRELLLPVIRAFAPLSFDEVLAVSPPVESTRAQVESFRVVARRVRAVGAIELSSTPTRPDDQAATAAVVDHLRQRGVAATFPTLAQGQAAALRARLAFAHAHLGGVFPDVSDEALCEAAEQFLGEEIAQAAEGVALDRIPVAAAVRRLVPWQYAHLFDQLVPACWVAPSGRSVSVDYGADVPEVRLKLQECFGLRQHPTVADVRGVDDPCPAQPWRVGEPVAVRVHLLSPAGRPLAVTTDVPRFFDETYPQVRKEMRGRYPKHPWPEDPLSAPATAWTKNRLAAQQNKT